MTQTTSGVTIGNVAVFADVKGNVKDGGGPPATGTGSVTSVSVATANGFAGTVATATTTPAITIKTPVTGLLKGNGTAVSAASAGTDYLTPTGDGSGLTNLTAANIAAGTAPINISGNAATVTTNANLTGDVTSVGNATTLTNAPVIAKVLTGFSAGAGTVTGADSILSAFQKVVGNTTALTGALIYQGTWNANTNTPTLTSSAGTKGFYYVVSVAGTTPLDGIASWNVGDTAIYNGTTWNKIDGITNEVLSVAGRTGVVVLTSTDVGLANVTNDAQTKAAIVPNTVPTSGQVHVGNAGGTAFGVVSLSGGATVDNTGLVVLGNPGASTKGGVQSIAAVSHNFLTSISTSGVPAQAQPAFTDISGNIAVSQVNSGTSASSTTFFRGDNTWATPSSGTVITSGTWAGRPGSPTTGQLYIATDLGTSVLLVYTGSKWKPVTGSAVLAQSGGALTTTSTTQTNLAVVTIPAGLLSANGGFRVSMVGADSAVSTGVAVIGHSNTSGDTGGGTQLLGSIGAAQYYAFKASMVNTNATNAQEWDREFFIGGATPVSVSTVSGSVNTALANYINLNGYTATGTYTLQTYTVEWIEP